jgi:hypothetical protein
MKRQCQQQRPDFVRIYRALMQVGKAACVAFFLIVPTASSAVQSPQEYFTTWDLSPSYLQKQFDVAAAGDMVTLFECRISSNLTNLESATKRSKSMASKVGGRFNRI